VKNNFDDYVHSYENALKKQLSFFDDNIEYFAEYKVNIVRSCISGSPGKILEYGCGVGRNLPFLKKTFPDAELYACDVSEKSLAVAEEKNKSVHFFYCGIENDIASPTSVPRARTTEDGYDLIFVANVYHHIPLTMRRKVTQKIKNMLVNNGILFVFEHNPYNPVTRHMVNTCPFDSDAVLMSMKKMMRLLSEEKFTIEMNRYAVFFPSFLRKLRLFEQKLGWLPFGGQYYIMARNV
jgi:SAM-dependent methyltransferase